MKLLEALQIPPGVVSVVGSGGKTTLLRELADEFANAGESVVLATTTRILPFEAIPTLTAGGAGEVARALAERRVVCAALPAEAGKLAAPSVGFDCLAGIADHVLIEADGSRRLPLKAHAVWEPVVPPETARTVLVVGASGFGRPVEQSVHRPEVFCRVAGCAAEDEATPELVALVIAAESLADVAVVNQCESPDALAAARELAECLSPLPVLAGSIREHDLVRL